MTAIFLTGGHLAVIRPRTTGYSITVKHPDGRARGYAIVEDRVTLGRFLMAANRECARPHRHPAPAWFGQEAGGRDTATYAVGSRYDNAPEGWVPPGTVIDPEPWNLTDGSLFDGQQFEQWPDDDGLWTEDEMDAWDNRPLHHYVGGRRVA